jgi:hypothetical protein
MVTVGVRWCPLVVAHKIPREKSPCARVHLDAPCLVDGSVWQAEAELADEVRIIEMRAAAPGQREAGHLGEHSGTVVDERKPLGLPVPVARP